jgi:3-phenylpropionate/trans-cinnamate dioxygenase ferredoxin subunit
VGVTRLSWAFNVTSLRRAVSTRLPANPVGRSSKSTDRRDLTVGADTMNTMNDSSLWAFVIEENKLLENRVNMVFPKGLSILLIKKAGQIYALSNKCAHMGCGMGGGSLKDYTLQCPCHDWRYDIRTGEFLGARGIRIPTYQWQSVDGKIFINIEKGGGS